MPPWNTGAGHGEDMPRKGIDGGTRIILLWQSQVSAWLSASGEDGFGRSPILEFRVAVRLPFAKGKEDPERSGLELVNTSGIGGLYWYVGMSVLILSVQRYFEFHLGENSRVRSVEYQVDGTSVVGSCLIAEIELAGARAI